MATLYSEIYDIFLSRISDYDLPNLEYEDREKTLYGFMRSACVKFGDICQVDLTDRDDEEATFNVTVPEDAMDIITTGMIVEWLKPKYYLNENLKNMLNTKDYSTFSPANLLGQIRSLYTSTKSEFESMINYYSYKYSDIAGLKNE